MAGEPVDAIDVTAEFEVEDAPTGKFLIHCCRQIYLHITSILQVKRRHLTAFDPSIPPAQSLAWKLSSERPILAASHNGSGKLIWARTPSVTSATSNRSPSTSPPFPAPLHTPTFKPMHMPPVRTFIFPAFFLSHPLKYPLFSLTYSRTTGIFAQNSIP
jgi:hypothetical protein